MYRSCTGICFTITMLQYYICLGIVLTVILVLGLGLGLGFGIILYFMIGTWSNSYIIAVENTVYLEIFANFANDVMFANI